jgi:hypothetical protein
MSGGRRLRRSLLIALGVFTANSALLLTVGRRFPLETDIALAILTVAGIGFTLYVGELAIVDLLLWLATPILREAQEPLECQQVGEILVVKLSDNIVSVWHCQMVSRQLLRFVDEHHCNFILDFSGVGRLSRNFREVLMRLTTAARREGEKQGRPYHPVALPPGEIFPLFADRRSALDAMLQHDGHGWVVLCSVPVGIRAVSDTA